jgi:glycosyltransferase involved in cell wall biosynthesis
MKVLWFCNCPMRDEADTGSGTWLGAMAAGLLSSGEVELGVIAHSAVQRFERRDTRRIRQWLVPETAPLRGDGLPPHALVAAVTEATRQFAPDLIQVWGVESYWGLLTARRIVPYPALLTVQGFKSAIANVFLGSLTPAEILRCIALKDILKARSLWSRRRAYARWSRLEREMLVGHRFIETQSPWSSAQVTAANPSARIVATERVLRPAFCSADPRPPAASPVIFTSWSYPAPFKGMHVAIRALALLRQRIPATRLRIAGPRPSAGLRQDGYLRWIAQSIRSLGLEDAVEWLGPLSADRLIAELQSASLALVPTFIESYCVAMAEAMMVGTPVVCAFTGGTSHLGCDGQTCLFFPPGDEAMCAYQMQRVLDNPALARDLAARAQAEARRRHDPTTLSRRQVAAYRLVLDEQNG